MTSRLRPLRRRHEARKCVVSKHLHEIRDPIHVFVRLDTDERAVLDSRPFQRLRHIHQLALTYLLYPAATHKRFEHSLGVMELAGRVFDVITHAANVTDEIRRAFARSFSAEPASVLATRFAHGRPLSRHGASAVLSCGRKGTPPRWLGSRAAYARGHPLSGDAVHWDRDDAAPSTSGCRQARHRPAQSEESRLFNLGNHPFRDHCWRCFWRGSDRLSAP